LFVAGWYLFKTNKLGAHVTQPFTSLITISGVLITLSFVMGVLALLADMLGRHRRITEELLYLARRKVYSPKRSMLPIMTSVEESAPAVTGLFEDSLGVETAADEPAASPELDREQRLSVAPVTQRTRARG
jgi:hypothetical protein